ncbi:hypothetical protein SBRY_40730 [Actinacidiphila bryophytorum]|uniref:Uncharacterized protein n=1 Tax=Actinacidiphila bryophytorum TaxID=1436133 RepID=A0A9W4MIN7_9ACTN|nr:hypothetical protein SBRY_40730 [Actinacidiphila bryophytorum]
MVPLYHSQTSSPALPSVAFGVPVVSSPIAMSESSVGILQKSIPLKPVDFDPPLPKPLPADALPPVELPVFADDGEDDPPPHAAAPANTITVAAPAAIRRIRMATNLAQRSRARRTGPVKYLCSTGL